MVKVLGNISHDIHLIAPSAIEPIQKLKVNYLGSKNPRLHTDEVLIALSASAATDHNAQVALEQLPKLKAAKFTLPSCSPTWIRRSSRSWASI